jgi:hypothetical protein
MELVNLMYGKEHAALRKAIWEKGFKNGQIDQENVLGAALLGQRNNYGSNCTGEWSYRAR